MNHISFFFKPYIYHAIIVFVLTSECLFGTLTNVANSPAAFGEPSLINNTASTSILSTLYGAGNYTRIDDSFDRVWSISNGTITAKAGFAANTEVLGMFSGISPVPFTPLLNVIGHEYAVTGSVSGVTSSEFRFGLRSTGTQQTLQTFSSLPSDNTIDLAPFQDHMVTFKITGSGGGFVGNQIGNYVIAFEDLITNPAYGQVNFISDRDFNDAIFEISYASPLLHAPEPHVYLLLGTMLAFLGMVKFRASNP